jgi:hypothetical protein
MIYKIICPNEPVPKPLNKKLEILQGGQTNNRRQQYKRYFPVTFHIY